MVYANEFEIEGLLATSSGIPGERKDASPRPDLILKTIDAYAEVLPNLETHAEGWPSPGHLRSVVKAGQAARGRDQIGEGHDTEASRWLIGRVDAGSPENPLNISVWGGQTDLAQALWHVKQTRGADGLAAFAARLRVYDIDDQDKLASWIRTEFPGLCYILSQPRAGSEKRTGTYRGIYLTGDETLTGREWIDAHVLSKGPLGALYPAKTWTAPNPHGCMKEGDTPSWFFFLPAGENDPADPAKPGWGGQFAREPDGWYRDLPPSKDFDPRSTVSRHRPAFQADFARRMTWCVK